MIEITDIEFTEILLENRFSENQIRIVLEELNLANPDFSDLTDYGFNAWQIRFLIKLFDVK